MGIGAEEARCGQKYLSGSSRLRAQIDKLITRHTHDHETHTVSRARHKTELGAWLESLVVAPHATHKTPAGRGAAFSRSRREVCSPNPDAHPPTRHGGTPLWPRPPAAASQEPCLESPPTRFATAARTPAGPSRSRRSRSSRKGTSAPSRAARACSWHT